MLLDTKEALYIWIGKLSGREDQRLSIQTALQFLQSDPSQRDMSVTIIHIKQGREPPTFTGFFPKWDKKLWKVCIYLPSFEHLLDFNSKCCQYYKTFSKIRQEVEMNNTDQKIPNGNHTNGNSGNSDFDHYEKYPINILREPNDRLPSRVDSLNKEVRNILKSPYY